MPKIVYVLEQLETLAERHEVDQEKLASLMIEKEKYLIYSNRDQAIQRQLEEVENCFFTLNNAKYFYLKLYNLRST